MTFSVCKCPWFLEKTKVKSIVLLCTVLPFLGQVFYDSGDSLSFLNAKGSKFWVQTIIFTMKYIEIRKSFIEYCPPLEPTKAVACICVDQICTIYESGVLALEGGGNDIWEPQNQSPT